MTDYQQTGKLYKKLNAYIVGNYSQSMPRLDTLYYFGPSIQFKTCSSFKAYLSARYPNKKIVVNIDK